MRIRKAYVYQNDALVATITKLGDGYEVAFGYQVAEQKKNMHLQTAHYYPDLSVIFTHIYSSSEKGGYALRVEEEYKPYFWTPKEVTILLDLKNASAQAVGANLRKYLG